MDQSNRTDRHSEIYLWRTVRACWLSPLDQGTPFSAPTVRIERIEGAKVTLADVLLHDIDETLPQSRPWQGLVNVGIEDMHLSFPDAPSFGHHLEEGYNAVYFTGAFDSWVRNLKVTNADSALLSYSSANLTFENVVTDGSRTAHYSVHMGNVLM